jgi:hypothetical protein
MDSEYQFSGTIPRPDSNSSPGRFRRKFPGSVSGIEWRSTSRQRADSHQWPPAPIRSRNPGFCRAGTRTKAGFESLLMKCNLEIETGPAR